MARSRSSARSLAGIGASQTGSLNSSFPCGLSTRYISASARCSSSSWKMLNRQFCAATSIDASAIGRLSASPLRRSTKSRRNQALVCFGGDQIVAAGGEHLVDDIEPDHCAGTSAEIGELQHLHAAADADIEDRRAAGEVARMDGAAATVVHRQHLARGCSAPAVATPDWWCSTAPAAVRAPPAGRRRASFRDSRQRVP